MQTRERNQAHAMDRVLPIAPGTVRATQMQIRPFFGIRMHETPLKTPLHTPRTPQARLLPAGSSRFIQRQAEALRFFAQGTTEDLTELAARPVQTRIERATRDAQLFGHLGMRQFAQVAQLDELARCLGQRSQGTLEQQKQVLAAQLLKRIEGIRSGEVSEDIPFLFVWNRR